MSALEIYLAHYPESHEAALDAVYRYGWREGVAAAQINTTALPLVAPAPEVTVQSDLPVQPDPPPLAA